MQPTPTAFLTLLCKTCLQQRACLQAYTGLELQGCTGTACLLVVSYDRLANGNAGPPGPHGDVDSSFTMSFVVKADVVRGPQS